MPHVRNIVRQQQYISTKKLAGKITAFGPVKVDHSFRGPETFVFVFEKPSVRDSDRPQNRIENHEIWRIQLTVVTESAANVTRNSIGFKGVALHADPSDTFEFACMAVV